MANAEDQKYCGNCKRDIAAANFVMHEVHCHRNIVLCKKCHEPYPRSELETHMEEDHAEVPCDKCNKKLERAKMENHKEVDCPKRMVKCAFCEIDISRDDLDEHIDYCGTRTEQCFKCQKFIMIKDQQRHEDSNCTYPEQKSTQNGATHQPGGPGRLNSFVFNEISRIADIPIIRNDLEQLTMDTDDQVPQRPMATRRTAQPNRPKFDKNTSSVNTNSRNVSKNTNVVPKKVEISKSVVTKPVTQKKNPPPTRPTEPSSRSTIPSSRVTATRTSTSTRAVTSTRAGGNNSDAAAGSSSFIDQMMVMPRSVSMTDQELAEYIGQFPDDDEDLNLGSGILGSQYSPEGGASPGYSFANTFSREKTFLPCEFCGACFPADELIQHGTECNPDLNTYQPYPDYENTIDDDELDIAPTITRAEPTIIDNLGHMAAQDWISKPYPQDFTDSEDTMLPCEFCDQLFPLDFLVQHQALCESNLTQTPRVLSPDVPRQRQGHSNLNASPVLPRRHQPDIEEYAFDSDSDSSPSRDTNSSRNSYMSSFGVNGRLTRPNGSTSTRFGADKNKSDAGLSRNTNTKVKQRTLDDLVNNPVPSGPTNFTSRVTPENRRERSTAFRPSKDTSTSSANARRMANATSTSSRASNTSNSTGRTGMFADSEASGYQASFAQPRSEPAKRSSRPVPKNNVGSNLSSLNGMGVTGRSTAGFKGNSVQNKKNDTSKR